MLEIFDLKGGELSMSYETTVCNKYSLKLQSLCNPKQLNKFQSNRQFTSSLQNNLKSDQFYTSTYIVNTTVKYEHTGCGLFTLDER